MKIAIGSDHAGFELKEYIKSNINLEWIDVGPENEERVDYPDYAHALAGKIESKEMDLGILICGSGQGVCMTANKHRNVRAALAWNIDIAKLSRQHNNANIICLPARFIAKEYALEIVKIFLVEPFEGNRHEKRVEKISEY